jgi:hypothetical protein
VVEPRKSGQVPGAGTPTGAAVVDVLVVDAELPPPPWQAASDAIATATSMLRVLTGPEASQPDPGRPGAGRAVA